MIEAASANDFHAAVTTTSDKPLVVFFSASWCGGCKMVAPKVATLAEELATSASFMKVSADELTTLCDEVEVDSFPHFRVYKEGKIVDEYTSSKFDKVDAFIRGLIAPDTVQKVEETPESDDTLKNDDATKEAEQGSKKRQERETSESIDEHVAKKVKKTDAVDTEKVKETENDAEKTEEVVAAECEKMASEMPETTNISPNEVKTMDATSEAKETKPEELVSADKIDSSDTDTVAVDAATTA